jgi:hypothetical protein
MERDGKAGRAREAICAAMLILAFVGETDGGSPSSTSARVITGSRGEQVCARHHQRLEQATVFGPGGGVCVLIQPSKKMVRQLARSPNALPFGVHRKADALYSRPVEVWFCARCEGEVELATRR